MCIKNWRLPLMKIFVLAFKLTASILFIWIVVMGNVWWWMENRNKKISKLWENYVIIVVDFWEWEMIMKKKNSDCWQFSIKFSKTELVDNETCISSIESLLLLLSSPQLPQSKVGWRKWIGTINANWTEMKCCVKCNRYRFIVFIWLIKYVSV